MWRKAAAMQSQGGPEIGEAERNHAGCVSAVHERVDTACGECLDQPAQRQDQGRRTRDVIDERQARPGGGGTQYRLDHRLLVGTGKGQRGDHHASARAPCHKIHGLAAGRVGVVRDQDLVRRSKLQGTQDGIHPRRRVRNEGQVRGIRTEKFRQLLARGIEAARQVSLEEIERLALHFRAQRRLGGEDRRRASTEGAMIEILDGGVEAPSSGEIRYDFRHGNPFPAKAFPSLRRNSPTIGGTK
jgi:hypothetical protein